MISINSSWNFLNFRAGLIKALIRDGYEIVAVSPRDQLSGRLEEMGCRTIAIPMNARGTSPLADAMLFGHYLRILRQEAPCAFIGYTAKPNIYGSLAAHLLGIPVVNNIAGLGTAFLSRGWVNQLVRGLYKISLSRSSVVFFQNPEDLEIFVDGYLVSSEAAQLLPGSGVDTSRFSPAKKPTPRGEQFTFLMASRLLWAKGVEDFARAAGLLRQRLPNARFQLLGIFEQGSGAIREKTLQTWVAETGMEYLGSVEDVRDYLAHADCVVLPTYYPEGTPRILLEAAAMGKPIIATDVPGCREVVRDGLNGFLVPPRNAECLAAAMVGMAEKPEEEVMRMGAQSRRRAETEFDEQIVIDRYRQAIAAAVRNRPRH